jgi:hypothetical protein
LKDIGETVARAHHEERAWVVAGQRAVIAGYLTGRSPEFRFWSFR